MRPLRESLNEAKLNLPQEYIDKVRGEASENIGLGGPSRQDMMQMQQLLGQIFQIQRGHEDELTELGIDVIRRFYGPVLGDIELDVKIVDPNDEEKKEMAEKMLQDNKEEENNDEPPVEVELELEGIEDDIDKRKLINSVMQGEAQNVHDMMYDVREQVTEITGNAQLLDMYMQFLALNRKFDWDETVNLEAMMEQMPEMANAMETEWEDEDEEGEGDKPKIKARVLDLPMLIHETVKGIYELIAAGGIDPDPVRAQKVLDATDTLADEQEDIRYGPFIAKDLRDYINKVAENIPGAFDIDNMREFVFGRLVEMPSQQFVQIITSMLMDEEGPAETIAKFIKEIQEEFDAYSQQQIPGYNDDDDDEELPDGVEDDYPEDDEEDNELLQFMRSGGGNRQEPEQEQPQKERKLSSMGRNELNGELNKAIDAEDWPRAQEIQAMIERKGGLPKANESFVRENLEINESSIERDIEEWESQIEHVDDTGMVEEEVEELIDEISSWFNGLDPAQPSYSTAQNWFNNFIDQMEAFGG